jgi:hypothetical protein
VTELSNLDGGGNVEVVPGRGKQGKLSLSATNEHELTVVLVAKNAVRTILGRSLHLGKTHGSIEPCRPGHLILRNHRCEQQR